MTKATWMGLPLASLALPAWTAPPDGDWRIEPEVGYVHGSTFDGGLVVRIEAGRGRP